MAIVSPANEPSKSPNNETIEYVQRWRICRKLNSIPGQIQMNCARKSAFSQSPFAAVHISPDGIASVSLFADLTVDCNLHFAPELPLANNNNSDDGRGSSEQRCQSLVEKEQCSCENPVQRKCQEIEPHANLSRHLHGELPPKWRERLTKKKWNVEMILMTTPRILFKQLACSVDRAKWISR